MKELKTEPIQIMLTPTQKKKLKEVAEKKGVNMSAYVRMIMLKETNKKEKVK